MSASAVCACVQRDQLFGVVAMRAVTEVGARMCGRGAIGMEGAGMRWMGRVVLAVLLLGTVISGHASTVEYLHTDALGSVVAVSNQAGEVIARREYEPYGRQLQPETLSDGPGYTGHVMDAATGLTYMQQRYYDPGIGRFLSVDPVTADGSSGTNFNRYWYANNNPYTLSDPDGRRACGKDTTCQLAQGARGGTMGAIPDGTVPSVPTGDSKSSGTPSPTYGMRDRLGLRGDLTKNGNILDMESLASDLIPPILDSPEGKLAAGGGLLAVRIGQAGDKAVRAIHPIGEAGQSFIVNGRKRIPGGVNYFTRKISEIKNTSRQALTRQLRDYIDLANSKGYSFDLYLRRGSTPTGPLLEAQAAGKVTIKEIPGP